MKAPMSQLSTWSERHPPDEEIPSILKNASLSNRIQDEWLNGDSISIHCFPIYKVHYLLFEGKCHSSLLLFYTLLRPCFPVFIQESVRSQLLSRGIYLYHTLQRRCILTSSKDIFADAIPITLWACQPWKPLSST